MWRWLADWLDSSCTICVSDPRPVKTRTSIREDLSRESLRPDCSAWSYPAIQLSRAADALGRRLFLCLSAADRAGILVPLVLLDRSVARRRASFPHAASLGRADIHRRGLLHVRDVGSANARNRCRQSLVESRALLQHQPRRQNATRWPIQCGPKVSLLGVLLELLASALEWRRPVVSAIFSITFTPRSAHRHPDPRVGGALYDWPFHDSSVYGPVRRTRGLWLRNSRRCFLGLRQALPSRMV